MAPKTEPARPSVEAILTDIHNTLTEGFEALLVEFRRLNENFEKAAAEEKEISGDVKVNVAAPSPAPEKPLDLGEKGDGDEIPKFVREHIEANPACKAADLVKEFKISLNRAQAAIKKYGKPAPVTKKAEQPKKDEKAVTVEMLRAKISEFSEAFGMNEALAVNEQKGGARKVSQIPVEKYGSVFDEMESRLQMKREVEASGNGMGAKEPEPTATIDDVRKVAQAFINKYNDPAFRELLKKFGGAKISEIKPENYAALIEALANA